MSKTLLSFLVIILSLGFAFLYVEPEYTLVKERSLDLSNLLKTAENAKGIEKLISETEDNLNKVKTEDLDRFNTFLPESIDTIRFANNLQHMGLAYGIVFSSIKVEERGKDTNSAAANSAVLPNNGLPQQAGGIKSVQEKKYSTTKAVLGFTTTYEKFGLFLNDIQESLGLLNLTELSLKPVSENPDTKKSETPVYQFTVTVETYSLK